MRFYAPTNVFIEKDCVENHKKELLSFGKKAYIITGRHSSKANGSLDDVTSILKEAAIPFEIFNDIEENPSVETVAKAAAIGKEFQADFVIGIGGGSPLDASKAIALLIANPEETEDCLYVEKELKALPIISVPTTCGTGSEVTPNAVLTRHEFKTKKSISYQLYPDLALVDGKYLVCASENLLVNTATDALAHLIESRLHTKANTYNAMFSNYGLELWGQIIPSLKCLKEGNKITEKELDEDTLEKFMLISTIAGMAIAQTGTSLPHALSYELTYNDGIPHGKACGFFLASYMKQYAKHDSDAVNKVLSLLGFSSLEDFFAFLQNLLGTASITKEDMERYTDNMMNNASKRSTYPFALTREEIEEIFTDSLKIC